MSSGNIEGIYHQYLIGWFSASATSQASELVLCVNGKPTITSIVDLPRPDVEAHLGCGANCGFRVDLGFLDVEEIVELSLVHESSGFDFNGRKVNYCSEIGQHFDTIRDIFYPEYYRCRYELCHLTNDEAFQDFIKNGIYNDRDPSPWFSNEFYRSKYLDRLSEETVPLLRYLSTESELKERPSELFDPVHYSNIYSDLSEQKSLIGHYSMYGRHEGRTGVERKLPEKILNELFEIAKIEPLIASAEGKLQNIVRYPQISNATYLPKIIHERLGDGIKVVICVPFISRGGADLVSTLLFRAYQGAYGKDKVLMLVTDQAAIDVPEWIDDDSKVICLDDECIFVDAEERLIVLHTCLGRLAPEKIINVNSNATWRLFERHGVQLSSVADLYAYLFCFDYGTSRHKVGYITQYLPSTLKFLKSVYFDNEKIINDVEELYGLTSDEKAKLHTVYIPASPTSQTIDLQDPSKRDTILWAGRLSLQKRPDVLIEIAKALPDQKFDVYGQPGNSKHSQSIVNGDYFNINYCGVFNSFDEIDLDKYLTFLNTSEWEGIPTIIIQLMAMGMPIITSSVGGIPELVTNETGWLIEDCEDTDAYVLVLRRLMVKPELASIKVAAGIAAIQEKHHWNYYYKRLESLNAFLDHKAMDREAVQFKDRRKAA